MPQVLFTSNKPLERAENIKAVYDAYDGLKHFLHVIPGEKYEILSSGSFNLRVTDEFICTSPGKAIMIGHGISGGKTYGLDQPYPYHRKKNAGLLTYVITTGEAMREIGARQSGVPVSSVLPLGMPRTDAYIGKSKGDGKTMLANRRTYLYVPTYRTREETPLPDINWLWIDKQLHDDELLAIKPHPVTKTIMPHKFYHHIVEIPADKPSAPYLYDCDVVITDYSSIMFDAYLLGKPVILFEKRKGYTETRGMYLDYPKQYSSRYCTDERSLVNMMRKADSLGTTEKECINLVASACDGRSTERVCDLIRSIL